MAYDNSLITRTNTSNNSLRGAINKAGIYDRAQIEWYTKFNRFGCLDPYNVFTTTKEYIFITKPDLHIFNGTSMGQLNLELKNLPLWEDAFVRYKDVLGQLQYSANNPTDVFINLLSNSVTSSLDLPGITATDVETSENIYGTHMTYRRSSLTTDEHHEFSLEFEDTRYLEVYMWFRLYDDYCRLKDLGMVTPVYDSYIVNKILDDQMAAYKLVVGEDGETLVYWAKLWGVYPKSVPRDSFSDLTGTTSGLKLSVNFHSIFVDDMDPTILAEFNQLTLPDGKIPAVKDILPYYDFANGGIVSDWAGVPFIVRDTKKTMSNAIYKLEWRRAD